MTFPADFILFNARRDVNVTIILYGGKFMYTKKVNLYVKPEI